MFHYELSRSGAEQPPVPEPAVGPIRRRITASARPADLIPWALLVVLALVGASALGDTNLGNGACAGIPAEEQSSWHSEPTQWPPGVRCEITFADGRVEVDEPGWAVVYVAAAGLAFLTAGFLHRRETAWRRMAHVLLVPATLVALLWLSVQTGLAFYLPAALLFLALAPAVATWMALRVLTTWPVGRTFVGSWLAWALGIGLGIAVT